VGEKILAGHLAGFADRMTSLKVTTPVTAGLSSDKYPETQDSPQKFINSIDFTGRFLHHFGN
jgi:hypothetical protein